MTKTKQLLVTSLSLSLTTSFPFSTAAAPGASPSLTDIESTIAKLLSPRTAGAKAEERVAAFQQTPTYAKWLQSDRAIAKYEKTSEGKVRPAGEIIVEYERLELYDKLNAEVAPLRAAIEKGDLNAELRDPAKAQLINRALRMSNFDRARKAIDKCLGKNSHVKIEDRKAIAAQVLKGAEIRLNTGDAECLTALSELEQARDLSAYYRAGVALPIMAGDMQKRLFTRSMQDAASSYASLRLAIKASPTETPPDANKILQELCPEKKCSADARGNAEKAIHEQEHRFLDQALPRVSAKEASAYLNARIDDWNEQLKSVTDSNESALREVQNDQARLVSQSPLGRLLASPKTRTKVGLDQLNSPDRTELKHLEASEALEASLSSLKKYVQSTSEIMARANRNSSNETLSDVGKMIAANPLAAGEILLDNPTYAEVVCQSLARLDAEDKETRELITGATLIAGGAGIGAIGVAGGRLLTARYLAGGVLDRALSSVAGDAVLSSGEALAATTAPTTLASGALALTAQRELEHRESGFLANGELNPDYVKSAIRSMDAARSARNHAATEVATNVAIGGAALSLGPAIRIGKQIWGESPELVAALKKTFDGIGKDPELLATMKQVERTDKELSESLTSYLTILQTKPEAQKAEALARLKGMKQDELKKFVTEENAKAEQVLKRDPQCKV